MIMVVVVGVMLVLREGEDRGEMLRSGASRCMS